MNTIVHNNQKTAASGQTMSSDLAGKIKMLREEAAAAEEKSAGVLARPDDKTYQRGRADGLKQAADLFDE